MLVLLESLPDDVHGAHVDLDAAVQVTVHVAAASGGHRKVGELGRVAEGISKIEMEKEQNNGAKTGEVSRKIWKEASNVRNVRNFKIRKFNTCVKHK